MELNKYDRAINPFSYKTERAAYLNWEYEQENLFWQEFAQEFDVENHPKLDILKTLAYEYGHSCGYSEIYHYASDLVELLTPC